MPACVPVRLTLTGFLDWEIGTKRLIPGGPGEGGESRLSLAGGQADWQAVGRAAGQSVSK